MIVRPILIALCIAALGMSPALAAYPFEGQWQRVLNTFEFMPEVHMSGDVMYYFNHKNADFRTRYLVESNSDLEFVFVSYRSLLNSVWQVRMQTGMGRQREGIVFDPREIRYAIVPSIEVRLPGAVLAGGIDHQCYHEIDRWHSVTQYWNKGYFSVSSVNFRPIAFRRLLVQDGRWDFSSRFAWRAMAGHYIRKMWGLVNEGKLTGGQNYDNHAALDVRYAFYKRTDWVVDASTTIDWTMNRQGGLYQAYLVGIEGHFRRGACGSLFFINWHILDQLPVRNKDKLVEFGVKFYN